MLSSGATKIISFCSEAQKKSQNQICSTDQGLLKIKTNGLKWSITWWVCVFECISLEVESLDHKLCSLGCRNIKLLSPLTFRDFNQIDAIFSEFSQNLVRLSQLADRQKGLKICKVYSIYCCPKDGYPGKISTFKKVSRITFLRILI